MELQCIVPTISHNAADKLVGELGTSVRCQAQWQAMVFPNHVYKELCQLMRCGGVLAWTKCVILVSLSTTRMAVPFFVLGKPTMRSAVT